ncbi:MAG TPA: leucine-rich repeat protein [Bacilli bacterium]|mgnify:CR=1 FL=1|nr:MAG: hypothetical protein BWY97_01342 [Tenericutes bacterium ADurb.BinA124]HPX84450.1 leucine-rich repeat protein [Bacilli bacterium]
MRNLWKLAIILFAACFLSSCNRLEELKTSLENNEVTIEVGKEVNVEVFAKEGFDVTWEVEDPSIVTVENGVFHAVSEGVTYVLVKSGDLETKIKVMVVLEAEEETFTITWLDRDETVLEVDENVPKGVMPTFDRRIPSHEGLEFKGWDPEVVPVVGDATYTATYKADQPTYTITWKHSDGYTITTTVVYGTQMPVYSGPVPTKESDVYYDYIFIGWSPKLEPANHIRTYTAQFAGIKRKYTVTWIDTAIFNPTTNSYTVLYTEEVEAGTTPIYSGPEPNKPDSVDWGYKYIFEGWDPVPDHLTKDMEFKTVYKRAYDCVWYNWYNEPEVLKQERYKMEEYIRPSGYKDVRIPDETPYEGETPRIFDDYGYSYEFLGWFSNDESRSWNDLPMTKTLEREYLATYQCIPLEDNPNQVDKFTYRIYDDFYYPACIITGYTGDDMTDLYIPTWIDGYMVIGIGRDAFRDNNKIINLYIGDNVRRLGYNTFSGCNNLSSIMFGLNMTYLGEDMFENCTSLNRVDIPEQITEIGYGCFSGCTSLMAVTLPDNLETIESGAFSGCEWLTEITIPDKVKWVKGFSDCIRLHTVNLGAGVIGIAASCFNGDIALQHINLDEFNLEHISDYAFKGCEALVTLRMPDSLKTIGKKAFENCTGLLLVSFFGDNPQLESINEWAFLGCSSLMGLSIPASVTYIGEGIVGDCEHLYSLEVMPGNQKYMSKSNMIIDIENQKIIAGCNGSGSIPTDSTITVIGSSAFYKTKKFNLNKTLIIPDNIKKIESYAFYQCLGLPSLDPTTVHFTDHDRHYEHCPKSVFVPSSVEVIQSGAFYLDYTPEQGQWKRYYCIYVDKCVDYTIRTGAECPEGLAYAFPQYSGGFYKQVFAINCTVHYHYEGDPANYPRGVLGTAYGYWHGNHVLWTFDECHP